ncbi:MAG: NADP-dependent oxidoreductase [Gammaproteobacteria bacterium]|nr:NADP-dependent oxidoreductase [Gammaproteobacteria bacterium]
MTTSVKAVLSSRPDGQPKESDFKFVEEELAELEEGQVLLKVEHLSIDAFIRTMLDGPQGLHGTMDLDVPVMALGVGRVVDSRSEELNQGDAVFGPMGAQTHVIYPANMLRKLDETDVPARTYLGALGMTTGLTAYAGMICCGKVEEGDTVVVSAAAGAVGVMACQLAKMAGARGIGIAGGDEKCEFLKSEIGCDDAVDYKSGDLNEKLKAACPDGINVFFDNVGGAVLNAALDNIAKCARVVICGAISQYNDMEHVTGPSLYLRIPERNASMIGFTVDHYADQFEKMEQEITAGIKDGRIKVPEHIEEGIESFPGALIKLMTGGHMGKLLVAP